VDRNGDHGLAFYALALRLLRVVASAEALACCDINFFLVLLSYIVAGSRSRPLT